MEQSSYSECFCKSDRVGLIPSIFFLLSFSLSVLVFHSYALLMITCLGMALVARFHLKGCLYAWAFLIVESIIEHLLWDQAHFWRLGIEISIGCSLLIYALQQEEIFQKEKIEEKLKKTKEQALNHLEDDLAKLQETSLAQKMQAQEAIEQMQKSLEDLISEKASFEVLNEVLRKNHAKLASEQEDWKEKIRKVERHLIEKADEAFFLQKEITHLKNKDALVLEHQFSLNELNRIRVEKEQMRLINEALVRMHAKDVFKLNTMEQTIEGLKMELQNQQKVEKPTQEYHQLECLHKQLKSQFEQKNEVLHQTRAALFKTDTELQALRIQQELHVDDGPFKEMIRDLDNLEKEATLLKEENEELEATITYLIHRSPFSAKQPPLMKSLREALAPKKKKIKAEQQQLPFP